MRSIYKNCRTLVPKKKKKGKSKVKVLTKPRCAMFFDEKTQKFEAVNVLQVGVQN